MLRHSSQICGEMSVDLLTNRKHLYEISGIFVYTKNAINVIWRLTLRRMLAESLEMKLLCKSVAFIVGYKFLICFPMDYRDFSVKSKVIIRLFQTVRLSLSIFTVCKFVLSPIKKSLIYFN